MLKTLLLSGLMVAASLWSGEAVAQKRIALVIGNSSYANVRPLPNPANDATAIADLFRAAHFDVVDASNNLGGLEMRRVFRDFAEKSRTADIAVVFYAGHGIEMDGTNYLLPVDTALKRDLDVEDEAISIDRVVRTLEPARRLRLIILDACRDNPFVRTVRRTSETRSIGRGLAKIEPPSSDTLIAFAAKDGSTASDGDGKHSPFTVALLKNLTTPGLDLRIALGRVRDDVMEATGNKQEPFVYGSLGGSTVTLVPGRPVAAAPAARSSSVDVRRDYELAAQVGTKEAWNSFLAIHGTGFYADLAARPARQAARRRIRSWLHERTPPATKSLTTTPQRQPRRPSHRHRGETSSASAAIATHHRDRSGAGHLAGADQAPIRSCGDHAAAAHRTAAARLLSGRTSTPHGAAIHAARWSSSTGTPARTSTPSWRASTRSVSCAPRPAGSARWNAGRASAPTTTPASGSSAGQATCRATMASASVSGRRNQSRRRGRGSARRQRRRAARRSGGAEAPAQVVCGSLNGCLNVNRGCHGERRASGHGDVAVVICDK